MSVQLSPANSPTKSASRPRIAIALEYPLTQQGGTEVLVRELLRGLSKHFELLLVSGDRSGSELPKEFVELICGQIFWDCENATIQTAKDLANELNRRSVQLAHFHFGGTYEWRSNRFNNSPVYYLARHGVP